MSAIPRLPLDRVSLLAEAGVAELLTLGQRHPERLYDVSEGGFGLLTHDPLPTGTLVLAVLALPGEARSHDVIVRVAWTCPTAMGLEFILPDDALLDAVARVRARAAA